MLTLKSAQGEAHRAVLTAIPVRPSTTLVLGVWGVRVPPLGPGCDQHPPQEAPQLKYLAGDVEPPGDNNSKKSACPSHNPFAITQKDHI